MADHVVYNFDYSGEEAHTHAGGFQIIGDFAVVPFEDPDNNEDAVFQTVDLEDPTTPISGPVVVRTNGQTKNAGAVAVTRTDDSKFMVMVFGEDASDVELFVSSNGGWPTTANQWNSVAVADDPFFPLIGNDVQNVQLVTECDNDEMEDLSGPLGSTATAR